MIGIIGNSFSLISCLSSSKSTEPSSTNSIFQFIMLFITPPFTPSFGSFLHSLRKRLYRQSHSNRPLRRLRFRTNRRYTSVQALFRPLDAQSTVLGILVLTCLYSLS